MPIPPSGGKASLSAQRPGATDRDAMVSANVRTRQPSGCSPPRLPHAHPHAPGTLVVDWSSHARRQSETAGCRSTLDPAPMRRTGRPCGPDHSPSSARMAVWCAGLALTACGCASQQSLPPPRCTNRGRIAPGYQTSHGGAHHRFGPSPPHDCGPGSWPVRSARQTPIR